LGRLGAGGVWMEREGFGHWYSGEVLGGLMGFLRCVWKMEDDVGDVEEGKIPA